jgi:hypothetical protein
MRRRIAFVIGVLLLVATTQSLQAGGWAAVTLDGWPAQWVAGEIYPISFMIRQHGVHPAQVEEPVTIEARHLDRGETVRVEAVAAEEPGVYRLVLSLPYAGRWRMTITPGWFPESVVTTEVVEAEGSGGGPRWWTALIRWMRGGSVQAAGTASMADTVRYGQELFVVKGCTACHFHAAVATTWSTEVGPNLTTYPMDAEWVRRWLADPAALRPDTEMPNLELDPHEIDALAAFLTAD